jgi:cytochrome c oxidase subunit III
MSVVLLFLAVIAAISGWWLSRQRLTAKPWLEEGTLGEFPGTGAPLVSAAKIGLGVFLAVVGSLFALLISAYLIRLDIAGSNIVDTARLPAPRLLWFNTGMLVMSSVMLQLASVEARRGQLDGVRVDLVAGAVSAFAFVAGQLLAWRQLSQAGYFLADDPAIAFFYLLTGMHGLHVLGGLAALGRTFVRLRRGVAVERVRQSVELCATYWHFLLLIWLVLFALVMGWANDVVDICRALLT